MEKPRPAFSSLSTESFRVRMRPHAIAIYKRLFPGCEINDLRTLGVAVHVLDKEFAIDTLATFPSGQWISIQEKYRNNTFLISPKFQIEPPIPDFTQEFMNAAGTKHESPGEWFKLGAQLYFYGWAKADESGFEKWALLDIAKYKLEVERYGGLEAIGTLRKNQTHGAATFYCIPITRLRPAWIATHLTTESLLSKATP
jgi:hypothetical protein